MHWQALGFEPPYLEPTPARLERLLLHGAVRHDRGLDASVGIEVDRLDRGLASFSCWLRLGGTFALFDAAGFSGSPPQPTASAARPSY